MDLNEHVINSQLGKALADRDGLDLREAIVQHTGKRALPFFRGSKPINRLWVSSNLDTSNACIMMPFGYSVGNHCAFILNVPIKSLVRVDPVKIVRPAGR
jgi:hypothetical protein